VPNHFSTETLVGAPVSHGTLVEQYHFKYCRSVISDSRGRKKSSC